MIQLQDHIVESVRRSECSFVLEKIIYIVQCSSQEDILKVVREKGSSYLQSSYADDPAELPEGLGC